MITIKEAKRLLDNIPSYFLSISKGEILEEWQKIGLIEKSEKGKIIK